MLKKLRRKVYRKIRFQTWYRKAYYYHRKRRDLDKTIAQYCGVDVLSDKKRLYRLRRDMIRSLFRYGSYYNEYFLFGYEGKDADYRDSFITEGVRMSYYPRMNDPKNTNLLENKYLTYQKFRDFYGRDVLRIKKGAQPTPAALEALRDFTQAHPDYIVKPIYAGLRQGRTYGVHPRLPLSRGCARRLQCARRHPRADHRAGRGALPHPPAVGQHAAHPDSRPGRR